MTDDGLFKTARVSSVEEGIKIRDGVLTPQKKNMLAANDEAEANADEEGEAIHQLVC